MAGWAEHDRIARRAPAIGVRRRVRMMIGLDLDDLAADAVEKHRRADQVGRHRVDAAVEEVAGEGRHRRAGFRPKGECDLTAAPVAGQPHIYNTSLMCSAPGPCAPIRT